MQKRHYEVLALIVAKAIVELDGCGKLLWHFTNELRALDERFNIAKFEIAVNDHVERIKADRPSLEVR